MSIENPIPGQCLCGAVTLIVSAGPIRMAQCHCTDCQKMTGTGHADLAFFKQQDLQVTGETKSYTSTTDSGNQATRHFCPNCGSRLHGSNSAREGIVALSVGCLDDHSWFTPQAVVYTRSRQDWDHTSTDIPNFEMMPPPPK